MTLPAPAPTRTRPRLVDAGQCPHPTVPDPGSYSLTQVSSYVSMSDVRTECCTTCRLLARPSFGRTDRPPDAIGRNAARSGAGSLADGLLARGRMLPRQVIPRQFYLITRRCT